MQRNGKCRQALLEDGVRYLWGDWTQVLQLHDQRQLQLSIGQLEGGVMVLVAANR